ncbi:MAG: hypothetical protein NZ781_11170 [Armatimonadetes bacterium]|nr:hypothetical protein [Armatimonadota bacterium]
MGVGGVLYSALFCVLSIILRNFLEVLLFGLLHGIVIGIVISLDSDNPRSGFLAIVLTSLIGVVIGFLVRNLDKVPNSFLLSVMGGFLVTTLLGSMSSESVFEQIPPIQPPIWEYRGWMVWWRDRPHLFALEQTLRQTGKEWEERLRHLETACKENRPVSEWLSALEDNDWMQRFIARYALVSLGGEAVEPLHALLQDSRTALRQTATHLIQDIAKDTRVRLASIAPRLLCPRCLVYCHAHSIRLSRISKVTYYGCCACHQSRNWLEVEEVEIVAVLDAGMATEQVEQYGMLRVNWLHRRALFDFDLVQIIQATDEDVERFCIQVGNDDDMYRRPRYRKMRCLVSQKCGLREETINMLRSMFGEVVMMD